MIEGITRKIKGGFFEITEDLKRTHIALEVEKIVNSNLYPRKYGNYSVITFENKDDPTNLFLITVIPSREYFDEILGKAKGIAENLVFPVFTMNICNMKHPSMVTTPYEKKFYPSEVRGPDDKIYFFLNTFIIIGSEIYKYEEVREASIATNKRDELFVNQVDFVPSESDSRLVKLDKEDTAKISEALRNIQTGKFRKQDF